jgi:hypothetical protein
VGPCVAPPTICEYEGRTGRGDSGMILRNATQCSDRLQGSGLLCIIGKEHGMAGGSSD